MSRRRLSSVPVKQTRLAESGTRSEAGQKRGEKSEARRNVQPPGLDVPPFGRPTTFKPAIQSLRHRVLPLNYSATLEAEAGLEPAYDDTRPQALDVGCDGEYSSWSNSFSLGWRRRCLCQLGYPAMPCGQGRIRTCTYPLRRDTQSKSQLGLHHHYSPYRPQEQR